MVGVITTVVILTNSNYNKQVSKNTADIQKVQSDIDALKADEDVNNFTPTQVVNDFFNEVKSNDTDTAKLYLAPDVQNMDTNATLKLGSDLSNVITGDNFEETSGSDKVVNMTFVLADTTTTVRIFNLSKFDDAWKITGITAE
jgi:hypothetical protein